MRVAIQVPIKGRASTRVPNKNFRELCGKPFSYWLLDELVKHCPKDWDIFIDSESESVLEQFCEQYGERVKPHLRDDWFAQDHANGNHLIQQFAIKHGDYDIFAQIFVTAVTLPGKVIEESIQTLISNSSEHDSLVLVSEETGWFWFKGNALNYEPNMPDGLPRSQDAILLKETTGLYAITRDAVYRGGTRIGQRPYFFKVPREYAFDIDTMEDFREAEKILAEKTESKKG